VADEVTASVAPAQNGLAAVRPVHLLLRHLCTPHSLPALRPRHALQRLPPPVQGRPRPRPHLQPRRLPPRPGALPPNFVPVPDKVVDDADTEEIDGPRVEGNVVLARRRERSYPRFAPDLAVFIKAPNFPELLANFLDDQLFSDKYPDDDNTPCALGYWLVVTIVLFNLTKLCLKVSTWCLLNTCIDPFTIFWSSGSACVDNFQPPIRHCRLNISVCIS
ncbi:hypothetical protein B0H10DRAFT_2048890, partial [Mycena sp. CBHHK59/15]